MKNKENEFEVFDKETVKNLLAEGYTQKEINEAKEQTERLMKKIDMMEYKRLTKHTNPDGSMNFKEVYETIDFSKNISSEEIRDIKKLFINTKEADVTASIIHLNNYRLENRKNDDVYVGVSLKYLKSMIDNYVKFNSFNISEECADKIKEAINNWSTPKNESKKIRIKIKSNMPQKKIDKYGLELESVFASQKDLAEFCGVTVQMIIKWKKSNYIEEIQ